MISILFTQNNSIYKKLKQDCWNKDRNARTWPGGNAIIAHPPCRAWGKFWWKSLHDDAEIQLAIFAINKIRLYGGIMEHPRTSGIWKYRGLQLPKPGTTDKYGGFTICIKQSWFGHRAEKETILYIVGLTEKEIPAIPITFDVVPNRVEYMCKAERERTPKDLALWLIETATIIENKKNKQND
jgi:hypothetical protein